MTDYPNSLNKYLSVALAWLLAGGIAYLLFAGVLGVYEGVVDSSEGFSLTTAYDTVLDGWFLLLDIGMFLLANPLISLGLVLSGYAVYLITRIRDQPEEYSYEGRPSWQLLVIAATACVGAAFISSGQVRLNFRGEHIAKSFVYALSAVYTAHYFGYTVLDDVANHGFEIEPWKRVVMDFAVRGSLLIIFFDAVFEIVEPAGSRQVGIRLLPPVFVAGYLGYVTVVDDSREELSLARSGTARQKQLAGGSEGSDVEVSKKSESPENFRSQTPPDLDFDDVGGMSELKARLHREVIAPLRNPEKYEEYEVGTVNGILLHGPPGTGKTYVSEALAGELGYNYIPVTPSGITSKYVGESADNVQELFTVARNNQPCVVFIDEFDAVAGSREGDMTSTERQMVNQLLEELSNLNDSDADIVVVAATNLIDEVDDAITRPGRFDTTVEVPKPDADSRVEILRQHLDRRNIETTDIDWERVKAATKGYAASNMTLIAENLARELIHNEIDVVDQELMEATIKDTRGKRPSGRTDAYLDPPPEEDLSSVAGLDEVISTLREKVILPLSEPDEFEEYGLSTVNGVLFYGPPGTGKTLLSRAVAGELGYNYIEVSPSDILSKYVGEASENIGGLFQVARNNQPCIIFFDEIDAIAPSRETDMNQSQRQMVNQLLQELEETQGEDVVVFAATNLIERVDDAVKRSKRFDERIEVPIPDADTRIEIIKHHLADRPLSTEDVDWQAVAQKTERYTGSDMELVAEEAARKALQRSRETEHKGSITEQDIMDAIDETRPSLG